MNGAELLERLGNTMGNTNQLKFEMRLLSPPSQPSPIKEEGAPIPVSPGGLEADESVVEECLHDQQERNLRKQAK